MRTKRFWCFYTITMLLLVLLAIFPVKEFVKLCLRMRYNMLMLNGGSFPWGNYRFIFVDSAVVIPFMAVIVVVLIGFLVLPLILKMPPKKAKVCVSVFAGILFVAIELLAEYIVARNNAVNRVMTSRMFVPKDVTGVIKTIPPAVRIHYYIFSIILILIILNFLYSLSPLFLKDAFRNTNKRFILLQGLTMVFYTLSYVSVKVMQYENYQELYITLGSVLNASVCIALASMAVGLFSGSFIKFEGLKKYLPSASAAVTSVALYGAEYIMLDGKLYSYGTHFLLTELPVIRLSIVHLIVILLPAVIVFFILKFSLGLRENTSA